MDFLKAIRDVCGALDAAGVRYALIGGFAMALRGVQRSTVDLDFILMLEDLEKADEILKKREYDLAFRSDNVSHYQAASQSLGRIDILHAFRGATLSMIKRADRIEVADSLTLPVVQVEDIIGLKIQAAVNDSRRRHSDWSDIRRMVETCSESGKALDWEIINDYLNIFDLNDQILEMKEWYGSAN